MGMGTQFGETAKECAESYLYYGKALLELSRLESGVLGNALDGVPEEGDDANNSRVEGESVEKKDEEEEPSNLQLAWEMLELAKVVYTKQVDSGEGNKAEVEEKLCSAMLALGEVSLENENYSQAVEDIQLCLKKQESLPKDM